MSTATSVGAQFVLLQVFILAISSVVQSQYVGLASNEDKRDYGRDFMHFGKRAAKVDLSRDFMNFGKRAAANDYDREFMSFGKRFVPIRTFVLDKRDLRDYDRDFMNFGKRNPEDYYQRDFMNFGRRR